MLKRNAESGRSLLEVVMYLGLVVTITAATISVYMSSVDKADRLRLENQLIDIVEKSQIVGFGRKGATDNNYDDDSKRSWLLSELATAGVQGATGTAIMDPYGMEIMIGGSGTEKDCMSLTLDVSREVCVYLVSSIRIRCHAKDAGTKGTAEPKVNGIIGTDPSYCSKARNSVVFYADKN